MSESDPAHSPTARRIVTSAIGFAGAIFMFVLILFIAWLPTRPKPVDEAVVEERLATLSEVKSEQHDRATTYGWIDQAKGVVRLPIERAMEIIVKESPREGEGN